MFPHLEQGLHDGMHGVALDVAHVASPRQRRSKRVDGKVCVVSAQLSHHRHQHRARIIPVTSSLLSPCMDDHVFGVCVSWAARFSA